VTVRALAAVWRIEWTKLGAQWKVRVLLGACAAGPVAFVAAIRSQSGLPEDTLFGRAVNESGFATPLVVLGFAAIWILPVLASAVGGDLFSADDRYGTWPTLLTRSCTASEIFMGKLATALAFSSLAIAVLALSSLAAGLIGIGTQPLIDLSGILRIERSALALVAGAWTSVLPAAWAFTAIAILVSIATRSSAAGTGVPVVASLLMQLCAYIDGPELTRRLLLTSGFTAWRGLALEPRDLRPLLWSIVASATYFIAATALAYRLLRRRERTG
jgi:ABC-2 type transport system permease protein